MPLLACFDAGADSCGPAWPPADVFKNGRTGLNELLHIKGTGSWREGL